jgi:hypothetical protein
MRSNGHDLVSIKRHAPAISFRSSLLRFGCGGWLILATLGNSFADEPSATDASSNTPPLPDSSAPAASSPTPANSPTPDVPLLPQQAANPFLLTPLSSSTSEAPQLTAPSLYTTGANDLSQIVTTAGLAQAFSPEAASGFSSEGGIDATHGPFGQLRFGPVNLEATLLMNAVSDDNLRNNGQTGGKTGDTSFAVTPAILLEYGTQEGEKGFASLVYSPTLTRFLHYSQNDSDDQNVALTVQYPFQKLTLGFSQAYTESTGINQDLNARTTQTSSLSTVTANYDIDEKLSLSADVQEAITSFSDGMGQGDKTSSVGSSLSYHLSEKMSLISSATVGLDKPDGAQQETFEQALIGVSYQPTVKISLSAQGGAEFRQGDDNNQSGQNDEEGSSTNPVFSLGLGYQPFDSTNFSLSADQSVRSSSADSGQTVVATDVGFSATQRFIQRFYLNLTFDYSHSEYQSGSGGGTAGSGIGMTSGTSQDTLTYRTSLSFAPTTWTSVAVYYQYEDNESDAAGQTYYDNELGVSASVQF